MVQISRVSLTVERKLRKYF